MVMGILNLSPDSFYSNSRMHDEKELLSCCQKMIHDGAAIIDIGGYSSRPGADYVSEQEEASRVMPALKLLVSSFNGIIISVDTFRSSIAKKAIEEGASIINDISAGEDDPLMMETIAALQVPYIMMHKMGTPKTMNSLSIYENVTREVFDYFIARTLRANELNIHDTILDPGFGFAKTLQQNYELLNSLEIFKILEKPVMVGISRKKMIQNVIQVEADGSLNGTTAAHTIALLKGAHILRVHDVKEAVECIKIVGCLN